MKTHIGFLGLRFSLFSACQLQFVHVQNIMTECSKKTVMIKPTFPLSPQFKDETVKLGKYKFTINEIKTYDKFLTLGEFDLQQVCQLLDKTELDGEKVDEVNKCKVSKIIKPHY